MGFDVGITGLQSPGIQPLQTLELQVDQTKARLTELGSFTLWTSHVKRPHVYPLQGAQEAGGPAAQKLSRVQHPGMTTPPMPDLDTCPELGGDPEVTESTLAPWQDDTWVTLDQLTPGQCCPAKSARLSPEPKGDRASPVLLLFWKQPHVPSASLPHFTLDRRMWALLPSSLTRHPHPCCSGPSPSPWSLMRAACSNLPGLLFFLLPSKTLAQASVGEPWVE